MKAFTKRIIWFCVFWATSTIDELVYYYINRSPNPLIKNGFIV
jgi:hypothetical protein